MVEWWDDLLPAEADRTTVHKWQDDVFIPKNPWAVKIEKVEVDPRAVEIVDGMKDTAVVTLGDNRVLRQGVFEGEKVELISAEEIKTESGDSITGAIQVLGYCYENNTAAFRKLLTNKSNWDFYCESMKGYKDEDVLRLCRYMRSITPARNRVSKKAATIAAGDTTLAKVRSLIAEAKRLSGNKNVVAYGVGNPTHMMGYVEGIRVCYDTDVPFGESDYYREGNLLDWEKHLKKSDIVLSDASYGESRDGGMIIPEKFYDIYRKMAKTHYVVCKVDKLDFKDPVLDVTWFRDHNRECFVLLGPGADQQLEDFEFGKLIRASNMQRMALMRDGFYMSGKARLTVDEGNLRQCKKVARTLYLKGEKYRSVVEAVVKKFGEKLSKTWKDYCMTPYRMVFMEEVHELDVDLPCVLMDVENLAKNKERLYHSFFTQCVMEYDETVGWVALSYNESA